jgi:hypothetical protein
MKNKAIFFIGIITGLLILMGASFMFNERATAPLSVMSEKLFYFDRAYERDGVRYLAGRELAYHEGNDAFDASVEEGVCAPEAEADSCLPNGYFLVAKGTESDELAFAAGGRIKMSSRDELGAIDLPEDGRFEKFADLLAEPQWSWRGKPFRAVIRDGVVVELSELVLPSGEQDKQ